MGCEEMLKVIEDTLNDKERDLASDLKRASSPNTDGRYYEYDTDEMEAELADIKRFRSFIDEERGSLLSDCRELQSGSPERKFTEQITKPDDSYKETLLYKSLHTPQRVELFKSKPKTIPDECAQLKEKIERMASKGHRGSIFGDARDRYRDLNCDDITGEPYTPL